MKTWNGEFTGAINIEIEPFIIGLTNRYHFSPKRAQCKDGQSYEVADSGCKYATEILGHQSKCLDCQMPECVLVVMEKSR